MNVKLSLVLLVVGLGAACGQQPETAIGREYYNKADFKRAAAHFQLALRNNPSDAEACYWAGMSYQSLADIAGPLGHRYRTKARLHLTLAVELEPKQLEYRRELFAFLLDSAESSGAARRQAKAVLSTVPESDPEYLWMHRRFDQARRDGSSTEARLARVLLAGPQVIYRASELAQSALSVCDKSVRPAPEY